MNRYDQDGVPHPQDSRAQAAAATARLAALGYDVRTAFEIEWVITTADAPDDPRSATAGPAYGYARLSAQAPYLRALVSALAAQGVAVEQIHPEYAAGQFELSVAADDPVRAADIAVLTRETIRAVSQQHGLRASFTPKFAPDGVGNGGHVHLSLWDGERNLCAAWRPPVRADRDGGGVRRRDLLAAARVAGDRRAVGGQLPAAGAAPLGGRVPGVGPGEPRGAAAAGAGRGRPARPGGELRGQVLRPDREPVPGGGRAAVQPAW